jgi:phenylacetate-CoA ligase
VTPAPCLDETAHPCYKPFTGDTDMYWDRAAETMERSDLERLALERLNATLQRAAHAPHYRDLHGARGAGPLASLADLARLPFTTKADLRDGFPYGFLAVPLEDVVRLHSSSGTTGNPTVIYHTKADIEAWGDLLARCMYMAGVRRTDVFQNMMGYGLFTGGIGFHYGAERLGALTIPIGPGNSKRQLWFMQQFRTTVVHILPSYALRLATLFAETSIDPRRDLGLRIAFVGAEPHTEETRRRIEEVWGIKVYNCYGLSEMCGPGIAFECPEQNGMHLWEDHFVAEVVDPVTGRVLPEGEWGELVLTSLARAATPLVRYRTRDLTRILSGPCPCGRTHRRIDRIRGRSDDMLIINGVNVFPMQVERTLMRIPAIGSNYLIEVHEENFMDRLHVKVELRQEAFEGTLAELEHLAARVTDELKAELGVTPVVKLLEAGSLPAAEGKAVRVVDLRPSAGKGA